MLALEEEIKMIVGQQAATGPGVLVVCLCFYILVRISQLLHLPLVTQIGHGSQLYQLRNEYGSHLGSIISRYLLVTLETVYSDLFESPESK